MRSVVGESWRQIKDARAAALVGLGMIMVNSFCAEAASVHPGDSALEKLEKTLPAILVAPDVTGDQISDIAITTSATVGVVELSRRANGLAETAALSAGALVVSTATDEAVQHIYSLSPSEKSMEDVGPSGITPALVSNVLTRKLLQAPSRKSRFLWGTANAAFDGSVTLGAYFLENKGARLDLPVHASSLAIGSISALFSRK